MLDILELIWDFFWSQVSSIWVLYAGGGILGFTIVLWILDRIFHIFDVLKR